ncbi:1-(5-phosphoribosyl)-5-[(5-phosphoribosylamino)methylideneamino]imidazole-4-carboxamide isomerase [Kytococcus sp. Marseille-QA3725]
MTARDDGLTCYPVLHLLEGEVVGLEQGDFDRITRYDGTPLEHAQRYAAAGAQWLHLVDLDALEHGGWNDDEIIRQVREATGLRLQVGGGVRSHGDVDAVLAAGAERVVVGSLAANRPEMVSGWIREFGPDRVTVALDARLHEGADGRQEWRLATGGRTTNAGLPLEELLDIHRAAGLQHVLATDISRESMLQGPGLEFLGEVLSRAEDLQVQAGGGVRSLDDVRDLARSGCSGVLLGKVLMDGVLDLADVLAAARG